MDPNQGIETGSKILDWFTDYGALQILAMLCIVQFISYPLFIIWLIKKIGRPLTKIANWLEDHKDKDNGT